MCFLTYIQCTWSLSSLQELVEERDNLEKQLSQLTGLLGQVEEKRLSAIKDMENMKVSYLLRIVLRTYIRMCVCVYVCMHQQSIDFGAVFPYLSHLILFLLTNVVTLHLANT